jgi:hypothetical protein
VKSSILVVSVSNEKRSLFGKVLNLRFIDITPDEFSRLCDVLNNPLFSEESRTSLVTSLLFIEGNAVDYVLKLPLK